MKELDVVKLKSNYKGLPIGTQGTIVHEYDDTHCEVEFVDSKGKTLEVLTTPIEGLELIISVSNKEG